MKYLLLILTFIGLISCEAATGSKPEGQLGYNGQTPRVFGFRSTQELLLSLKSDIDNRVSTVNGDFGLWTIVQNKKNHSLWSFTPENHPAHPSVVKRAPVEKDGQIFITTEASCNAKKSVCDQLVNSFVKLNNKVRQSFDK